MNFQWTEMEFSASLYLTRGVGRVRNGYLEGLGFEGPSWVTNVREFGVQENSVVKTHGVERWFEHE